MKSNVKKKTARTPNEWEFSLDPFKLLFSVMKKIYSVFIQIQYFDERIEQPQAGNQFKSAISEQTSGKK